MEVTIKGKKENTLLKRTELEFTVENAKVPPARKELREKIAAMENKKPEQVIISKISHGFGSTNIEGKAHIYASKEDAEKTELYYMVGRNKGVKKGKEAEAKQKATEAAPAEKPAEEAPAEKPAEAEEKPAEEEKKEEPAKEKKEGEQ